SDGAKGLLAMRRAGWHTIAQDEDSSVVYGMPKAAAKLNAASEILPIGQIGTAGGRAAHGPLVRPRAQKRSQTLPFPVPRRPRHHIGTLLRHLAGLAFS